MIKVTLPATNKLTNKNIPNSVDALNSKADTMITKLNGMAER